ncbi:MAG TPA: FG-GAP-like repeat-containing protein [Tepidisphaeraceae bacterium]|nr:FG-GAP-like repeat-containing protein [Tepidisphaeraceae bacterium]
MSKSQRRFYPSNQELERSRKIKSRAILGAAAIETLEQRTLLSAATFGTPVTVPLEQGSPVLSMAVGDLNGDGLADLVISNSSATGGGPNEQVLLSKGDGTFKAEPDVILQPNLNNAPYTAIADVNGDHIPDILQSDFVYAGNGTTVAQGGVGVALGNGDGTFTAAADFAHSDSTPLSFQVADLNHDGKADLVISTAGAPGGSSGVGSIIFDPGKGDGTFTITGSQIENHPSNSVVLADFRNNGLLDLATSYGVEKGNNDGSFSTPFTYPAGNGLGRVIVADFNGDGLPDVALAPDDTQTTQAANITILINNGLQGFNASTVPISATATDLAGLTAADINGDGHADLIATLGPGSPDHANNLVVIPGNGDGTFGTPQFTPVNSDAGQVETGDVYGLGRPDVIVLNPVAMTATVFPNTALGVTTATVTSNSTTAVTGDPVQFTASVKGGGTAKPTGTVTFLDGSTPIGTQPVRGDGRAILTITSLAAGDHAITASYSGDTHFGASTSAAVTQTIQSAAEHNAAEVSVQVASVSLPSVVVPGDKGTISLTFTNNGNAAVSGHLNVKLYASASGAIDSNAVAILIPALNAKSINLKPGRSIKFATKFVVPVTLAPGSYNLIVQGAPGAGLSANQVFGGAVNSSLISVVSEFGTVGNRRNVTLVHQNSDGSQTLYSLNGPGTGTLDVSSTGVSLTGTTGASQLKIVTRGGSKLVSISTLTVNGSLGKFIAPNTTNLTNVNVSGSVGQMTVGDIISGTVQVGSAGKLTLGTLSGSSITSKGAIGSLSVKSWTGATNMTLAATSIGKLSSAGEFDPGVSLHSGGEALRSANIGGAVSTAQWGIHGSIGSVFIKGACSDMGIFAGTDFGADNARGGSDDTFAAASIGSLVIDGNVTGCLFAAGISSDGTSLLPGSSITVINVKGTVDSNSAFIAASLPTIAVINGSPVKTAGNKTFEI